VGCYLYIVALVYLGTDFHDTPLADLEHFETTAEQITASLHTKDAPIDGVVVLATCNRFEVYFEADSFHESVDHVTQIIAQHLNVDASVTSSMLKVLYGDSVPQHLFSVAAGLESMIIGEEEISGQVKRSLSRSQQFGVASKNLHKLFQQAATVAKSVTSETGLGASGRSVITTALEIAGAKIGSLSGASALLIGTGAYSRVVSAALERMNVCDISVYSRAGRAQKFSASRDLVPITADQLDETLARVDLVVSASGTNGYAITSELAERIATMRGEARDLICVDVSLSKDIDPEVSQIAGFDVIDLEHIKQRAPKEHFDSLSTAREIIRNAVEDFENELASRSIDPVVAALRAHIRAQVDQEVEHVRRKSGPEAAHSVQRSLKRVTNALLHTPSVNAKELAANGKQDEYVRAVRLLFDIEVSEHA